MIKTIRTFVWKTLRDQSGQTLPFVALAMTGLLGAGGLVVDVGHAYVVRGQLQNSANAAALAAAGLVYTKSSQSVNTTTEADLYGATGTKNPTPYVIGDPVVAPVCLNLLMPKSSAGCVSGSAPNAVKVTQTAKVPTFLMAMFGVPKLTVSATATASMQGSSLPWNIAIIVDSTGSMASTDSNCNNLTQFQCALTGVQALLEDVNPCPTGITSCDQSIANVRVSLFTFPNVLTAVNGVVPTVNGSKADSIADDIACGGSPATWNNYNKQPIAAPYTLPVPGATLPVYTSANAPSTYDVGLNYLTYSNKVGSTTTTWDATYQITPFLSDYQDPIDSSGLNANSSLVKAVGHGTTSGCLTYTFGIWGTGGGSGFGNTYVASSMYAAQSALASEQASYGGQNAMILLSDGDMNASYYSTNSGSYGTANTTNQFTHAYEFPSGPSGSEVGPTTTSYPVPAYFTPATISSAQNTLGYDTLSSASTGSGQKRSGTSKGNYPDWYDQCQQAMQAGQYSTSHSTTVFSVAYGASTSGCNSGWSVGITDSTTLSGVSDANAGYTLSTLNPCVTMENIASSMSNFYSDWQQGTSFTSCKDSAHSTVSLSDIFQAIAVTFATPQLLPNNAT
jgi:Putative Flp pilus-assembly TadE/G-like